MLKICNVLGCACYQKNVSTQGSQTPVLEDYSLLPIRRQFRPGCADSLANQRLGLCT
uniref:Uncharacterized protein n=1 Tax=Anguilla anguilla TaxID=7936 RepID=A0A0E9RHE4_ANGAN